MCLWTLSIQVWQLSFFHSLLKCQEYATEESQQYKEGQVILERALVTESEGIDEIGDWIFGKALEYFVNSKK